MYGGRISGRNEIELNVKVNPIYNDNNHNNSRHGQKDHNGNMNGLYLEMYETFPRRKDQSFDSGIQEEKIPTANTKTQQPVLLGPISVDHEPKEVETKIEEINHNQNSYQQNMKSHSETLEADALKSDPHSDELLSNFKTKVPNGNYSLLGYNNEGYVETEQEVHVENSLTVNQNSLTICNSIESSPSRSSVSSNGSPSKNAMFLTEVYVHSESETGAKLESPDHVSNSDPGVSDSEYDPGSDWHNIQTKLSQEENSPIIEKEHVNSVETNKEADCSNEAGNISETHIKPTNLEAVILTVEKGENLPKTSNSEIHNHTESNSESKSKLLTKNGALISDKLKPKSTDSDTDKGNSSTRILKSILLNTSLDKEPSISDKAHTSTKSDSEIHESKSVKFSKDTIFNENKSKKYKTERIDRIHLRNMYHGKISSDNAIAKLNPLFNEDLEEHHQDSLTDDEKVAYRLSVHKMINSNDKVNEFEANHIKMFLWGLCIQQKPRKAYVVGTHLNCMGLSMQFK